MSEIIWEDPKPRAGLSGKTQRIMDELESRPGVWAKIGAELTSPGLATHFKRGRNHLVETTSRRTESNRFDVFARWIKGEN